MRIGIVNDLRMACEALRRVVTSEPGHEVAWTAYDGAEAIDHAKRDSPDLILMDLIMPRVDGVEATRTIMSQNPCPILIVTSSVSGNISRVYDAMGLGAVDAVDTPVLGASGKLEGAGILLQKIAMIQKLARVDSKPGRPVMAVASAHRSTVPPRFTAFESSSKGAPRVGTPLILIGASTGGPTALARVLKDLPRDLHAAVIIVQHVDEAFAPGLARWLEQTTGLRVRLAESGQRPEAGTVLIAHTNDHLLFGTDGRLTYSPDPRQECYRPSVDVLFRSVIRNRRDPGVAVILTGMGRDGAAGLAELRAAGWYTIAQDRESSTVYGMPKAAAELSAAIEVLPLGRIGRAIVNALARV